jgi:hypothetical protein
MARLFAVIRTHGPAWKEGQPLEQQDNWRGHADFMEGLEAEGFAVFAGPLEGTRDALVILSAGDAAEVRRRLQGDPWGENMLKLAWIAPWDLRLGAQHLSRDSSE